MKRATHEEFCANWSMGTGAREFVPADEDDEVSS